MQHPDLLAYEVRDRQLRYRHQAYMASRRPRPGHSLTTRLRAAFGR